MPVFLLGGEGFIGQNIVEVLAPNYDCTSIDVNRSRFLNNDHTFIAHDPYEKALPLFGDILIHLIDHEAELKRFNEYEMRLINNVQLKNYKHVIIISSAALYSNTISNYGKRKQAIEQIYNNFCAQNNIPLTVARVFNTYGKYQQPDKPGALVATLIVNAINQKVTTINDMKTQRDFVSASDIGSSIESIINRKITGTLDIGTGSLTSVEDVINIIDKCITPKKCQITDRKQKENNNGRAAGNNPVCISTKFQNLEEGLKNTISFYRQNIQYYDAQ